MHSIKLSGYRMRIKFDKDRLAAEQNNYATKIANAYIVYELDSWSYSLLINCLFGATSIAQNSEKERWVYSVYGIEFDEKDMWSFGNDYAKNVVIFGVGNSSLSYADNHKNDFLVLGEGDTFGINESFGAPEKKFSINFTKVKAKGTFSLNLHYNW